VRALRCAPSVLGLNLLGVIECKLAQLSLSFGFGVERIPGRNYCHTETRSGSQRNEVRRLAR
jgi:hypothetical protein